MSLQVFSERLRQKIISTNQERGPGSVDVKGLLEAERLLNDYIQEQCHPNDEHFRDAISLARLAIRNDEVERDELQVDDDAEFSETDDGVWVGAWIYLANEDIEAFRKAKGKGRQRKERE